jgi:putative transposase
VYFLDLRQRVIEFIETGGGISKAARTYRVSRATIYRWLDRKELKPTEVTRRKRGVAELMYDVAIEETNISQSWI